MAFAVGTVLGVAALQEAVLGRPMTASWTAFGLGVVAGVFPCLFWGAITSLDGSASWRQGAEAELWTAEELEALGMSWRIEHDVPFPVRRYSVDVDHIAIGPPGVLVLETKWTSHPIDLTAKRLRLEVMRAVQQAEGNAGRVRGLLRSVDTDARLFPVVVFWGPHVTPPSTPVRRAGDVRIVAGKDAVSWRPLLDKERLDGPSIDRLAARVRKWRVEQDQKAIGGAVSTRLRRADRLGRISLGVAGFVALLLTTSWASDGVDEFLARILGSVAGAILGTLLILPLVVAIGGLAYVWNAWRLDPEVAWVRRLIPLGTWTVGLAGLMLLHS